MAAPAPRDPRRGTSRPGANSRGSDRRYALPTRWRTRSRSRDRDGEIGRWLRQRPAIHAEERHDPAQTVADPIVDMLCRRGGAHGRDLALQRPEAQTLGQSGLGVIREILGPHGADDELLVRVSKA